MFVFVVIRQRALHLGELETQEHPGIDRNSSDRRDACSCVGVDGEWNDERVLEEAIRHGHSSTGACSKRFLSG